MRGENEESLENSQVVQMGARQPASQPRSDLPAPIQAMRDGDVFRFAYSPESWERAKRGLGHGDLNWCFDGQLVYRNGLLFDTYWGLELRGDNGRTFKPAEAKAEGTLRFVCNLGDVEKIQDYEFGLYAEGDAFNLTNQHGCRKHFVKRRGAKKDPLRMRMALDRKVSDAKDSIERAVRDLEYAAQRRAELLPKIEAGEEVSI